MMEKQKKQTMDTSNKKKDTEHETPKNSPLYAKRLLERRKILGLSQKELATMVRVSVNTIQSYENGNLPRGEHFLALARALGCSLDWLAGLDAGAKKNKHTSSANQTNFIADQEPHWNSTSPSFPSGYIKLPTVNDNLDFRYAHDADSLSFDRAWLAKSSTEPGNVRLITVQGHSMYPTLQEGDLVLVDLGNTAVHQGRLYAISIDGHTLINRLENRPEGILRIISDNKEIAPPYEVSFGQINILGNIFWMSRRLT